MQTQRIKWMQSMLKGIEVSALLQAQVRNTLEHFDEYLDDTALRSSLDQLPTPAFMLYNMILGRDKTFDQFLPRGSSVYLLRVYLAAERIFISFDKRIDVAQMYDECVGLCARLISNAVAPPKVLVVSAE